MDSRACHSAYPSCCAGGAIGRATGNIFAREGAAGVAFADINLETAKSAAEESRKHATNPNYKAIYLHVDVADESSVNTMVETTVSEFGGLNYAVNAAGVSFVGGEVELLGNENNRFAGLGLTSLRSEHRNPGRQLCRHRHRDGSA